MKLGGILRRLGMLPFLAGNRLHVVPALNITDEEAWYGLALIDQALTEFEVSPPS